MSDDHALSIVGMSAAEEDAYRALLSLPDATAAELAVRIHLAPETTDGLLARLVKRGLVTMIHDDRFVATAPEASIVCMLGERLDELRRGFAAVADLEQVHRSARARYGSPPDVETISGFPAIQSRFNQLLHRARDEACVFMLRPLVTAASPYEAVSPPGVRHRMLYEKSLLDDHQIVEQIRQAVASGTQVRFAGSLPVKLLVADRRVALIMESANHPVALATEHPALVAMAVGMFEQAWPTAVPAPAHGDLAESDPGEPRLSDPDQLLLSLLLAGLTDQAIAARLGVGLRTVQRRVRDLMDAANVDTRIQLGFQASRKGWVD